MTGEDKTDTNGQEHVHFEDQLLLDDVIDQDVTVPHREKEEGRISWSQIRTTAPDLYAVSLLIFFFGIAKSNKALYHLFPVFFEVSHT